MAYDRLEPVRALILRLQTEGRTLTEIADELSRSKGIETTPATVSRYLKSIGKPQSARELTAVEEVQLDTAAVLVELLAEVRGRGDEQRAAIETLAGKVAIVGANVAELEQRIAGFATVREYGTPERRPWLKVKVIWLASVAAVLATATWMLR